MLAAVPGANMQKNVEAERKSRRALGDIGNLVTIRGVDGKPLPQVSRPVTRGFCAKLLANAEAAAADKNKNLLAANAKGPIVLDGPRPAKKAAPPRNPVQKKPVVKPKPEEVVVISPDTEEVVEKKLKEKAGEKSRKKAPTLTSTLTARSKVGTTSSFCSLYMNAYDL